MTRRLFAAVTAIAALAATGAAVLAPSPAIGGDTPPLGPGTAGPPYGYDKALMGQYTLIPLPDQAMITRTAHGYVYRAGQQDSHLVVTLTDGRLRFADTGTQRFKKLARRCQEEKVKVGVAAVCRVPHWASADQPLLLEVWPRLGDDYFDGSALPESFASTMLGDAGHDTALFGAGPDFFNGFTGRDRVWGGDGNDWIRTGDGPDDVWGGGGDDQLVGTGGRDTFYGESGHDLLGGGTGDDVLDGGSGTDLIRCESGRDTVLADQFDRLRSCEVVNRG